MAASCLRPPVPPAASAPGGAPPSSSQRRSLLPASPAAPLPPHLLLRLAADVRHLRQVHAQVLKWPAPPSPSTQSQLVALYSLFDQMNSAELAFQRTQEKSAFAWNAMIRGFATHGFPEKALHLYCQMLWSPSSPQPDKFTFPFVLKACAALDASKEAREAHGRVLRTGLRSDVYISTALVDLYMKLSEPENARQVFVRMTVKNTIAWNAMIAGYAYNGLDMEAVSCLKAMVELGVELNSSTMVCILPAIARLGALDEGKLVHKLIADRGIEMTEPVRNSLIDMYVKCGQLGTALILFEEIPEKSVVSWNIIISAYAHNGETSRVMELFEFHSSAALLRRSLPPMLCCLSRSQASPLLA